MFSVWKEPGRLERHRSFGLRRVRAHAQWQMLASLAQALQKALSGGFDGRVAAYWPAGLGVAQPPLAAACLVGEPFVALVVAPALPAGPAACGLT